MALVLMTEELVASWVSFHWQYYFRLSCLITVQTIFLAHFTVHLFGLYLPILNIRILCGTLSKALLKLSTILCFTFLHMCSHLIFKTTGLVRDDLLCINSCWHLPITFLSLMWLEINYKWTCSVKFPESELQLTYFCSYSCSFSYPSWKWVQYLLFFQASGTSPS